MKNMMKKTLAALAALAIMLSVVMPYTVANQSSAAPDCWEQWDDGSRRD